MNILNICTCAKIEQKDDRKTNCLDLPDRIVNEAKWEVAHNELSSTESSNEQIEDQINANLFFDRRGSSPTKNLFGQDNVFKKIWKAQ